MLGAVKVASVPGDQYLIYLNFQSSSKVSSLKYYTLQIFMNEENKASSNALNEPSSELM